MTLLFAVFLSPIFALAIDVIVVAYAKLAGLSKPSIAFLIGRSVLYAVVGVIASLVLTIIAMVWYEASTGYGAGNGPLGWIFFYGPLSAALGQMAALAQWWFKKRSDT